MSAKRSDSGRIQEAFDVVTPTRRQIASVGLTRESFLNLWDDTEDLAAGGITNRVLRATEEAGHIEEGIAAQYGFDSAGARSVRNRLAHVYGDVDRDIIWQVIEEDFGILLGACVSYCDDNGIDLRASSAGEALRSLLSSSMHGGPFAMPARRSRSTRIRTACAARRSFVFGRS